MNFTSIQHERCMSQVVSEGFSGHSEGQSAVLSPNSQPTQSDLKSPIYVYSLALKIGQWFNLNLNVQKKGLLYYRKSILGDTILDLQATHLHVTVEPLTFVGFGLKSVSRLRIGISWRRMTIPIVGAF